VENKQGKGNWIPMASNDTSFDNW